MGDNRVAVAPKVVILDSNFPNTWVEEEILGAAGVRLEKGDLPGPAATEDAVIARAADADGIIVQYAPLTARVIQALERCRIIARYGVGVDNVDVAAASARGIWVANAPGFCTPELAEHTMALILSFARRLAALDRSVRAGQWDTIGVMGPTRRLSALTLGLVGFGRVGQAVAARAKSFGLSVVVSAPRASAEAMADQGVRKVALDEVFATADVVSLHLPLTPSTRHLVDARRLALMKPSAFLINTSRGPIVDEAALILALREGRLAGAGLDVLEREPPRSDNPLLALDNVILTPHAAYYSDDALATLQTAVAREVVRVLQGDRPGSPVNPEIAPR